MAGPSVEPPFKRYIFIEKSAKKAAELEKLKGEFPEKKGLIHVESVEANSYLTRLCRELSWSDRRARPDHSELRQVKE